LWGKFVQDKDGDQWLVEITAALVTVKSSRRTSKTVPIRDHDASGDPGEVRTYVVSDVCIGTALL
jgi:hypothetical protein